MATKKKAKKRASGRTAAKAKAPARRSPPPRAPRRPARQARRQPESLRLRSASPSFTVNDVEKSLAWYRDVLGFTVKDRWEQDGRLLGAEMVAGSTLFMIGQDDWKKGRDRVKGEGFRIYCTTVQDVDRLAAQVQARGGKLTQEPRDQSWGARDFALADPDGFQITISGEMKK
jgi:uncharacterized glyoxalase superfamily protein PhnB